MASSVFPADSAGTPSGITAARPASPVAGDTFYNGTLGYFEIYNTNNQWQPINSPPGTPTISSATNVGTSRAYNNGAATIVVAADATDQELTSPAPQFAR